MKNWIGFIWVGIWMVCSFPVSGQKCQEMVDMLDSLIKKGEYLQIMPLALQADSICLLEVGNENKLYGHAINGRGAGLLAIGKNSDALPWFRRASEIYKKSTGIDSDEYGGVLNNIAIAQHNLGRFQQALITLDSAINIALNLKDTASYANRLSTKGAILTKLGNLTQALDVIKQSLILTEQLKGKNNFLYLTRLSVLLPVLQQLGLIEETIQSNIEARDIAKALFGENHPNFFFISSSLGAAYTSNDSFKKAEEILEPAVAGLSKFLGEQHPSTNMARNNLGATKLRLGKFDEALAIFETVRFNQKNRPVLDPISYAALLSNMALTHSGKKEYRFAMPLIIESRSIIKDSIGTENQDYIRSNNNLGVCSYYLADVETAKSINEENIHLVAKLDYKFAGKGMLLMNTAQVLHDIGEKQEALEIMRSATDLILKQDGEASYDFGFALKALGNQLFDLNYPEAALDTILLGLSIMKKHVGEVHPEYAEGLLFIANIYSSLDQTQKAQLYYEQALAMTESSVGKMQHLYPKIAINYAFFLERLGDTSRTRQLYREADSLYYQLIDLNFAALGESGVEFFAHSVSKQFDHWKSFGFRHHKSLPEVPGLFYDDELVLKGLLLNSSRSVLDAIKESNDSTLLQDYLKWRNLQQLLAKQYSLPINERHLTPIEINATVLEAASVQARLTKNSETFRSARQPIDWKEVQKALNPGEAAIEFMRFHYSDPTKPINSKSNAQNALSDSIYYCALVLRPEDEQPHLVWLFEEKSLKDQLRAVSCGGEECFDLVYRGNASVGKSAPNYSHLFRLIWQPLDSLLRGDSIIYYAPAGLLHRVAFPAIARSEHEVLLDQYDLHCVGSTREIVFRKPLHGKDVRTAWVFGGIHYETDSLCLAQHKSPAPLPEGYTASIRHASDTLLYLPGTDTEREQVSGTLEQNSVAVHRVKGCEAMEELVKSIGRDTTPPDVFHLPTHGFFCDTVSLKTELGCPAALSGDSPNSLFRSGLVLAGAQQAWTTGKPLSGYEDGILYAYEVASMDLTGMKLVVLSACETGLGDLRGGEGVYGLQRAFKLAGVQHVVMSLWKVPDAATAEFMNTLYGHWMNKMDLRKAFHQTQKDLRQQGFHPYSWAGFVLL